MTTTNRPAADRIGELLTQLIKPLYDKVGLEWRFHDEGCPAAFIVDIENALLDLKTEALEDAGRDRREELLG